MPLIKWIVALLLGSLLALLLTSAATWAESSSTPLEKGVYYGQTIGDFVAEFFRKVVSLPPDQADLVAQVQQGPGDLGGTAVTAVPQDDTPRVVAVFPARGAQGVKSQTEIRIRFDRPMDPLLGKLTWQQGGFARVGEIRYDEAQHEFVIPVRLLAGTPHRITLNEPIFDKEKGFQSRDGEAARRFLWEFTTAPGADEPVPTLAGPKGEDSPKLHDLLRQVVEARTKLYAVVETVSVLGMRPQLRGSGYGELSGEKAVFRMQDDRRFYGDVSTIMNGTFRVGSDGQTCWWHFMHPKEGPQLTLCAYQEMDGKNVSVCEPFGSDPAQVASLIEKRGLRYEGQETLDGQPCHVVACRTDNGYRPGHFTVTRWWIDARTFRPAIVTSETGLEDIPAPFRYVYRFSYEHVNEEMPEELFQVPQVPGVTTRPAEPLREGYQKRFLNVIDGSQGSMSVRWGMHGAKGTRSDGLN